MAVSFGCGTSDLVCNGPCCKLSLSIHIETQTITRRIVYADVYARQAAQPIVPVSHNAKAIGQAERRAETTAAAAIYTLPGNAPNVAR